jgi:hypothetical protein
MTRTLIIVSVSAAALFFSPAFTQERSQGTASIPDFSGIWGNPYLYGIEPPLSGPGPVVNKARRRQTFDVDGRPLPHGPRFQAASTREGPRDPSNAAVPGSSRGAGYEINSGHPKLNREVLIRSEFRTRYRGSVR